MTEVKVTNIKTGEESTIKIGKLSARAGGNLVKRLSKIFALANQNKEFRSSLNSLISFVEQSQVYENNPALIWQACSNIVMTSDIMYDHALGFISDTLDIPMEELEEYDLDNVVEIAVAIKQENDFKMIKTLLGNFQIGATAKKNQLQKRSPKTK